MLTFWGGGYSEVLTTYSQVHYSRYPDYHSDSGRYNGSMFAVGSVRLSEGGCDVL